MMKRNTALILSSVMVLSLAACNAETVATSETTPATVVEKATPYPLSEILVNVDYISEITEQFFSGWRDDIALMETFDREKIVDKLDDLIGQLYRLRGEVKHGTCVERNQKN